jgi:transcriptional regulator with XRE-family HTH domain
MTLDELGELVGMSRSNLSIIERNGLKGGPDSRTLMRISEALDAPEVLIHHCETCPIRNQILIKYFPDLNNIRTDPAVIAARLRKEMVEGAEALDRLSERFSDKEFRSMPDYREVFEREMEQVVDVKRGIEILEFQLVLSGLHTSDDIRAVYNRQQAKCEAHGHHKPELRTGTEG